MRSHRFVLALGVAGLALSDGWADPVVIPAAEAAQHEGELCSVEFVVRSTRTLRTKQGTLLFLNSATTHRAPENVILVFDQTAAGTFAAAGIRSIENYYVHKQIRVTETIHRRKNGALEMRVRTPNQIQVVDANPTPDPRETPPPPENQAEDFDPTPPSYLTYYFLGGGGLLLVVGLIVRQRKKAKNEEQSRPKRERPARRTQLPRNS